MEEETKTKNQKSSKADKQFYWALGIMVGLIAVFLLAFTFSQNTNNFDYHGLKFQKEMFGELELYRHDYLTEEIARSPTGLVVDTGKAKNVIVYLRNDPRELNVPVEGKIDYLPKTKNVYITLADDDGLLCEYSTVAMANFVNFMSQNGFVTKAGFSDEASAEENEQLYVTCDNHPNNMVLSFESGEETSIVREEGTNCYRVTVANCEILEAVDKFIVQSLVDAQED